ncbi:hypothetical protein GGR53DRAFT_486532 [Hypoxylon sp. FL1150]|nr:hypothetical protein GGR53DRAFT_486532 [Hypoxylon sp. FL1150]
MDSLAGTFHMILPDVADNYYSGTRNAYICCLFASHMDGRHNHLSLTKPGHDSKEKVHSQVDCALLQLRAELYEKGLQAQNTWIPNTVSDAFWNSKWRPRGEGVNIYMSKDNSSDFRISWTEVESLIQKHFGGWMGTWNIWTNQPAKGGQRDALIVQ